MISVGTRNFACLFNIILTIRQMQKLTNVSFCTKLCHTLKTTVTHPQINVLLNGRQLLKFQYQPKTVSLFNINLSHITFAYLYWETSNNPTHKVYWLIKWFSKAWEKTNPELHWLNSKQHSNLSIETRAYNSWNVWPLLNAKFCLPLYSASLHTYLSP